MILWLIFGVKSVTNPHKQQQGQQLQIVINSSAGAAPSQIESSRLRPMNQSSFPAALEMVQSFFSADHPAQFRVDMGNRLTKENATKITGKIAAVISITTNTEVHYPDVTGLIDEIFHNLGWQDHAFGRVKRGVDLDGSIGR